MNVRTHVCTNPFLTTKPQKTFYMIPLLKIYSRLVLGDGKNFQFAIK